LHVSAGVIICASSPAESGPDFMNRKGTYATGKHRAYWHFVDLVWVFIFAFFYLGKGV